MMDSLDEISALSGLAKSAVIVGLGWYLLKRYRPRWAGLAAAVLVVIAARFLLFGNPWAWMFYERQLAPDYLDWRQINIVEHEKNRFLDPPGDLEYLAVGSSQIKSLFALYAERHEDLALCWLPALRPVDYILIQDYIKRLEPGTVLLHLSELDMARRQNLSASTLAPSQGFRSFQIYPQLAEFLDGEENRFAVRDLLVGELLPEYKYRFLFRRMLDKLIGGESSESIRRRRAGDQTIEIAVKIDEFRRNHCQEGIESNILFLIDFLELCRQEEMEVVIVEGQYNPLARTDRLQSLNRIVLERLNSIADRFDHVTFIPKSRTILFGKDDYIDVSHVRKRAGDLYAESLLRDIRSER